MNIVDIVVLVVYFLAMAAMGPYFARKNKNTESYFLGNRAFPGWLIGLSMFATSISSITFVAYPADAYKTAYLRFLPALMLPLGIFIASLVFLPFFRRAQVTSAFEYLEGRFGPGVRMYAAIAFIIGQVIRLSLILYLVALLVYEMTHFDPYLCILIGGVVTSFYTVTGGIEAVIWTDFIQSFLLWGGGLVCLVLILMHVDGGFMGVIREASAAGKFMLGDLNPATGQLEPAPWGFSLSQKTVVMMLLIGLGTWLTEYSSNQNVIQKYVATKNPREATRAIWICCLCSVPTWGFFMFLGTSLFVFFKQHPSPEAQAMLTGAGGAKAEQVLPYFVIQYLPRGMAGLVIAGVLAAAMSSLSSSINAISAVGITDVYRRHVVRNASEQHYFRAAKMLAIASSVVMLGGAFFLMVAQSKTLQDTATKITAITGGGLLGLYCLGFLTKRGDGRSVGFAIVCTVLYSLWIMCIELKWVTVETFRAMGFNEGLAGFLGKPMDTYYAGLIGNLLLFLVAYLLGSLLFRRTRDLKNLTIWDQDWSKEPEAVPAKTEA